MLSVKLNILKLCDYIEYKTAVTMYINKVKFQLLPTDILWVFSPTGEDSFHGTRQRVTLNNSVYGNMAGYEYVSCWSEAMD